MVPDAPDAEKTSEGFWYSRQRPVIIAHRYGNSAAAARAAESAGADLLEADVWLHRGRLEARHAKTAGPLPIIWDRWWIARRPDRPFEAGDLLRTTSPETPIMFDLKGQNKKLPHALIDLIQRQNDGRRILVCTQDWRMLEPFQTCPGIDVVHSIGSERRLAAAWDRLGDDLFDAVSIHRELLDPDVVTRLKSLVTAIITWPVSTADELNRVLGYGVDGFTSGNLELIRRFANTRATGADAGRHA